VSDGTTAVNATAVRGKPNIKTIDAIAIQITERYTDWMIKASELESLDGKPERGWTITANGDTYAVTTLEGSPPWSWVDSGETEYRIHTIKIEDF